MTVETVAQNRRIYLIFEPGSAGRTGLRLSLHPPASITGAMAALIVRGLIMDGAVLDVDLVTDLTLDPELTGPPGDAGPNGWTPVLVPEADGTRTLMRVADWIRSAGKPATGYLSPTGALVAAKADAFNFNAIKRVDIFTGLSISTGVAPVVFDPPFTATPAKALPIAVPNLLAGPVKAEIVAGSLTKSGCSVKVTTTALVTGVASALAGASVSVIVIEA